MTDWQCTMAWAAMLAVLAHVHLFLRWYGSPPPSPMPQGPPLWADAARKAGALLGALIGMNNLAAGLINYRYTGCMVSEGCGECTNAFMLCMGIALTTAGGLMLLGWLLDERRRMRDWRRRAGRRWEIAFRRLRGRSLTYGEVAEYIVLINELVEFERAMARFERRPPHPVREDVGAALVEMIDTWEQERPRDLRAEVGRRMRTAVDLYVDACLRSAPGPDARCK